MLRVLEDCPALDFDVPFRLSHDVILSSWLPKCSFDFSIRPMKAGGVKLCSYSELQQIVDFKGRSLKTSLGRLFCGTIGVGSEKRPVIVKTCDFFLPCIDPYLQHPSKFCDELELFMDEKANTHKNLVKLCTFCCDKRLAVVYDEDIILCLSDVLLDDTFGWDERINVAIQLADLLAWLHEKRIAVGSIIPSCIMIDEEVNIKVFDFGFVSNHVNEDSEIPVGYLVGREAPEVMLGKRRTMKSDVYIIALILLELVTKKEYESKIDDVVKRGEEQLVDGSFNDATAWEITHLISKCMIRNANKRPTMKEVFDVLK